MKTSLLAITLLATPLLLPSAYAVEKADTVAEAKQKARETNEDYIVLAYGKDWEYLSTEYKKRVWDNPVSFEKLDGKTLVCSVTFAENPTQEEAQQENERNKEFGQGVTCFPQVYLFDKTGFCYATLYGSQLPKRADQLALKLESLQKARKKRDALIARSAEAGNGKEKAKLLGQAGEIPSLHRPGNILEELKKADPEDESGYQKRFTFNAYEFHKYFNVPKDEAMKAFKEAIASPAYTPEQKQMILGVQSTVLRRNNGTNKELRDTFQKMYSLAPNSPMGKAAKNAMKAYVK